MYAGDQTIRGTTILGHFSEGLVTVTQIMQFPPLKLWSTCLTVVINSDHFFFFLLCIQQWLYNYCLLMGIILEQAVWFHIGQKIPIDLYIT